MGHNAVTIVYIISRQLSVKHIWQIKETCTKGYLPPVKYAVYHCVGHARVAVNCVIAAVTWSDVWTNHCRSAFCVQRFTFRILPIAPLYI